MFLNGTMMGFYYPFTNHNLIVPVKLCFSGNYFFDLIDKKGNHIRKSNQFGCTFHRNVKITCPIVNQNQPRMLECPASIK